jgi:hypothetical protein
MPDHDTAVTHICCCCSVAVAPAVESGNNCGPHLISYGIVLCDISCRTATTTTNNNPNYKPCAAPWLTKLANAVLTGRLVERQVDLARDAVDNLQRLGPTYIKLGQIMSIRCVT